MTVIIGLMCADGGILASDSQATDIQAAIRVEVESKIFALGGRIAWGSSGPVGLQQVLKESLDGALRTNWPQKTLDQLRVTIVNKVTGRQREAVAQFVPATQNARPPAAEVLICGHTADCWLLEVAADGQQQQHFKFCAVGSGKATAYRVWNTLRHYVPHDESIEFGKFLAYRIVHDVITADFALVGLPVRIWTIRPDGATELAPAEVDALAITVDAWKEEERRSLRRALEGRGEENEPG